MKIIQKRKYWHLLCVYDFMTFLRSTVFTSLAISLLAAATVAKANSIVLTQDAYSYDVGGEFSATTTPQSFLGAYVPGETIVNGGFETFCVETTVDFNPGSSYTYNLSNSDSLGRQLTEGAAFLYYEFASGNLSGYNYNSAATRKTDAGLLQAAIWWFQGNQTYNDGNYTIPTTANNQFYALAINTLGANATSANNGLYNVEILELWNSDGTAAQNQLVYLPDGGMTAALFGMSFIGMFLIQFRRRKVS